MMTVSAKPIWVYDAIMTELAQRPRAAIDFAPPRMTVTRRDDGALLLRSPEPLAEPTPRITDWLVEWAARTPERVFLAAKGADGGWRRVRYGQALTAVRARAQALLDHGLGPERPLMILSDNSIEHALLALAAMHVGVPACPVSPAYALMSEDHGKLIAIAAALTPGLVFAEQGALFAGALASLAREVPALASVPVVTGDGEGAPGAIALHTLTTTEPGPAVEATYAAVTPDTVAKVLFTSGSTGTPKGVLNTHRMLTSNQQMIRQVWPFVTRTPPEPVDWLPWNHTFGGNHNFNMVLANGGTLYIDSGKPAPNRIQPTIDMLREISPTVYFNVPRGFDILLDYLERDTGLRDNLFARLQLIFYAGAALPQTLWDRLEALSLAARGELVPLVSAWGSTETSPLVTSVHFPIPRAGVIGLPVPGTELKLLPSGDKLEMRVRGPNVTPGYWRDPDRTRSAFDDEGFYCIGDAGRFADPDHPEKGLVFDGRVAENFKLTTGTWVDVGTLRVEAISALAPVAQDCVITGHDQAEVGLLIFVNPVGVRSLLPAGPGDLSLAEQLAQPTVRTHVAQRLAAFNAGDHLSSSRRLTRALLLATPPDIDKGEITDKGYINQRAVLAHRAALVEALYTDDPAVIYPAAT